MTWRRRAITAAIALGLLAPLLKPPRWDDFPLSSYPMFARGDLGHVVGLAHAQLVHRDGSLSPAPIEAVGTPEPMVANGIIFAAIENGTAAPLCESIARNVKASDVIAVEVVLTEFDVRTYFRGSREPLHRYVKAHCSR